MLEVKRNMAKCRNLFWLIFSLCLVFQAAGYRAHTTLLLQNVCIDGVQTDYTFPVDTGAQVKYSVTSDYQDSIDCRILLTSGREWIGLVWRELIVDTPEQKMPDCERAFIELSTPKRSYKFCGRLKDMPPFRQKLEFYNIAVTLRLFVNFTEPPTTWLPTTAPLTSTSVTPITSTSVDNVTTSPYIPPEVRLTLDVTAFSYCTSPGPQDLMCRQSRRCIDESLRCDGLLNCVSPAFWKDNTDETQCQKPPPPSLKPLWVTLGALGAFLVAFWCFYKPGYLPWRLARCRNVRCCGRYLGSRGCCNGGSGSNGRSVTPIIKPVKPGSSVRFSTAHKGDVQIINDDKDFNYQVSTVNWMSIKYDDGNHQRELR